MVFPILRHFLDLACFGSCYWLPEETAHGPDGKGDCPGLPAAARAAWSSPRAQSLDFWGLSSATNIQDASRKRAQCAQEYRCPHTSASQPPTGTFIHLLDHSIVYYHVNCAAESVSCSAGLDKPSDLARASMFNGSSVLQHSCHGTCSRSADAGWRTADNLLLLHRPVHAHKAANANKQQRHTATAELAPCWHALARCVHTHHAHVHPWPGLCWSRGVTTCTRQHQHCIPAGSPLHAATPLRSQPEPQLPPLPAPHKPPQLQRQRCPLSLKHAQWQPRHFPRSDTSTSITPGSACGGCSLIMLRVHPYTGPPERSCGLRWASSWHLAPPHQGGCVP